MHSSKEGTAVQDQIELPSALLPELDIHNISEQYLHFGSDDGPPRNDVYHYIDFDNLPNSDAGTPISGTLARTHGKTSQTGSDVGDRPQSLTINNEEKPSSSTIQTIEKTTKFSAQKIHSCSSSYISSSSSSYSSSTSSSASSSISEGTKTQQTNSDKESDTLSELEYTDVSSVMRKPSSYVDLGDRPPQIPNVYDRLRQSQLSVNS